MKYNGDLRDRRLKAISDCVDAADKPGFLQIGTADMQVVLATFRLQRPPFDEPVSGILKLRGCPLVDKDASATGEVAAARFVDGEGNVVISDLTAGLGGPSSDQHPNVIVGQKTVSRHDSLFLNSFVLIDG